MEYKLYKLTFNTPVHFGSDIVGSSLEESDFICHSDTFFSALCLEYIKLNGAESIYDFVDFFNNGNLLISSLLPYKNNDLYIPKPSIVIERSDTKNENKEENSSSDRKKMKKLNYIKVSDINAYLNYIKGIGDFNFDYEYNNFAKYSLNQKVGLRDEENRLYSLGTYSFYKNNGLYFALSFSDNEKLREFEKVLKSLSYSGIGGKRTQGLGNFEYNESDFSAFGNKLFNDSKYKMLISLFSPTKNEMENIDFNNSFYSLIKRNGFIYSNNYSGNLSKRKSLSMFKEGSCFTNNINGDIKDVSQNGNHKVYRYGKAFYIGIDI
ncbi:type III-A CRISPR-associated RAMP protein Csm4 [Brachyspira sp.]|uniref:type III-A CRISPR-associated RAMP protein Csm4 n=1 Tax=Brachyspira sp. TaxID=1977261 RepID=UPI003D7C8D4E